MRSLMVFIFMAGSMFVFISGITFEEGLSQDSDWAIALHGEAGFIAVDHRGFVFMKMNTTGMFRAGANEAGFREIAIW